MKKRVYILASLVFIFLFIGCDVRNAVDHPEMSLYESEETLFPLGGPTHQQETLSEDPPRTPVDLRELVLELQNVTPLVNRTDYDLDGLYDSVEAVIGTNPKNNDTDFDLLNDTYEALNGLDPLNPDSNNDGIADSVELDALSLDLDSDAIPNAWDFDNDGDGVNDGPDLSPFATSELQDGFDITIQTFGDPAYIRFQIVPENPDHMKVVLQTWDWETGDDEGIMRDMDDSSDDIRVNAVLELTLPSGAAFPNETALEMMGVVRIGDILEVPMLPVYESGSIIALSGQLLYLEPVVLDMTVHAEMKWNVLGQTDIRRTVLNCRYHTPTSDKYLAVGNDMIAIGNATREQASELDWIYVGPSPYDWCGTDSVAIKLVDGPYLSWENHAQLAFTGTEIGPHTTFYFLGDENGGRLLAGSVWRKVIVRGMGEITTSGSDCTTFGQETYYESEPRRLVQYSEP
ncbi:MAG: hypothetical protein ACW99J_20355, partial [Candidatus Thorarchaeota archaeon]